MNFCKEHYLYPLEELCVSKHPINQWEFVYYSDLMCALKETVTALMNRLFTSNYINSNNSSNINTGNILLAVLEEEIRRMRTGKE